jgi:hypothetical protein
MTCVLTGEQHCCPTAVPSSRSRFNAASCYHIELAAHGVIRPAKADLQSPPLPLLEPPSLVASPGLASGGSASVDPTAVSQGRVHGQGRPRPGLPATRRWSDSLASCLSSMRALWTAIFACASATRPPNRTATLGLTNHLIEGGATSRCTSLRTTRPACSIMCIATTMTSRPSTNSWLTQPARRSPHPL